MIARRVVVRGVVQGVGFRYALARRAEASGVRGWVRNRADGAVEAVLEGDASAVEAVADWCRRGPRGAAVDDVALEDAPPAGYARFEIRALFEPNLVPDEVQRENFVTISAGRWRPRRVCVTLGKTMGRTVRAQAAGMYHVMTWAVYGSWLFADEADYAYRLAQLAQAVAAKRLRLHMYCLMGNHEHWLVSVEDDALARAMQQLNRSYAVAFNCAHLRKGRVYGRPYESKPVLSQRYLQILVAYLALNPEAHGFGRAESYRYSSYPALIGVQRELPFVDSQPLLDCVGGGPDARRLIALLVDDLRLRRRSA